MLSTTPWLTVSSKQRPAFSDFGPLRVCANRPPGSDRGTAPPSMQGCLAKGHLTTGTPRPLKLTPRALMALALLAGHLTCLIVLTNSTAPSFSSWQRRRACRSPYSDPTADSSPLSKCVSNSIAPLADLFAKTPPCPRVAHSAWPWQRSLCVCGYMRPDAWRMTCSSMPSATSTSRVMWMQSSSAAKTS